jgi:hypothetical protein
MSQIKYKTQNLVDENQTRAHAGLLVLLMVAYLFSSNIVFIYILVCDFLMRIYVTPYMSPIYLISTALVKIVGFKEKLTDEDAKEFASHIGLTILFVALGAELLNQTTVAFSLIAFLTLWKIVEATKEFCFACKFYELLKSKNITVESL